MGASTIQAIYSGDPDFDPSPAASLQQKISAASTSATLAAAANPSHLGNPVTLTATVTVTPPSTASPTGTIKFYDGSKVLATKPLAYGVATLVTPALPAGVRMVKAQYLGDSGFARSNSPSLSLTIDGGTTTSLARTPNKARVGQPVTFTATVSPVTGGGTPTGTVNSATAPRTLAR